MPCPRTQRQLARPGIKPATFWLIARFPYRSAIWPLLAVNSPPPSVLLCPALLCHALPCPDLPSPAPPCMCDTWAFPAGRTSLLLGLRIGQLNKDTNKLQKLLREDDKPPISLLAFPERIIQKAHKNWSPLHVSAKSQLSAQVIPENTNLLINLN